MEEFEEGSAVDHAFHEMSLEDEVEETFDISVKKGRELTPSKVLVEPDGKRLCTKKLQPKRSGRFCKERQERFQSLLKENFVESPGKFTDKDTVLKLLDLSEEDKGLATRTVHKTFPTASVDRNKETYKNIRRVTSFELKTDCLDKVSTIGNADISNIQNLLVESRQSNCALLNDIIARIKAGNNDNIEALLEAHKKQSDLVTHYSETLDKLYEKEIIFLMKEREHPLLSQSEKSKLFDEVQALSNSVNIGLRSGDSNIDVLLEDNIFETLVEKISKECPFLYAIVKSIFPTDDQRKEKGAVHSLSLLMSLRNSHCQNDITLVFTLMLVAYGAGSRLVNMLNRIGIAMHWDTLMGFLDKYKLKSGVELHSKLAPGKPLIVLMDNVNIYRGHQRHHRLFKGPTMNMWNFTVRGLLNPNITGLEELFKDADTSLQSQESVAEWTSANLDLENNDELLEQWNQFQKRYILTLLKDGLNKIPPHGKQLHEMSERECNEWLSKADFTQQQNNAKIRIADINSFADTSMSAVKSDVHVLPLSLEDNSTLTGTGSILEQFATEFSLSSNLEKPETLPFNTKNKTFTFKQAREHVEFVIMMNQHKEEMKSLLEKLQAAEREYSNTFDTEIIDTEDGSNDDSEDDFGTTLSQAQKHFTKCDKIFKELYNKIADKVKYAVENDSIASTLQMLSTMKLNITDHVGRTLLHAACEHGNYDLACCLLQAGCNPNAKELCGATPLVIAVIEKNKKLCDLLLSHRSCATGPLFVNIPSPLEIAKKMQLTDIQEILLHCNESDSEDDDIASYDVSFKKDGHNAAQIDAEQSCNRVINRQTPGFLTGVVGDQGTCKTNRGVMGRTSLYKWVGIVPGDMHAKGHFCEACFKEQGPGGFHFIVNTVMKRPKLISDTFKKKKFETGNLCRIKEAVLDGARSYGLAAVMAFANSEFYPDSNARSMSFRKNGNHNGVLCDAFLKWVQHGCISNVSFKYYSRMFLYYGPLLEMFDISTCHVLGEAREACYVMQLPTFAHLNFPNYYTESFIHVVNFLGKWPLAFRKLIQRNCAVNLSGNIGSAIELDAFVEAEIVQPLKVYVSGHTSVKMCERIMASIDLFKAARKIYSSKQGFDEHTTRRHSVPDSYADQLKGMWFCLRNGFFKANKSDDSPNLYALGCGGIPNAKVPKSLLDVKEKGENKITVNFKEKLYLSFPDLHFQILTK